MARSRNAEEWWRRLLTGENPDFHIRHASNLLRFLPSNPRCQFCNAPYSGVGGQIMRLVGKGPSRLITHLCQQCQSYASHYLGGAEVELTMLFADVRSSTRLAEQMSTSELNQLISRFFAVASETFTHYHAWVDRFVGDQAVGYFVPGFAGPNHALQAIQAAQELLKATRHGGVGTPWIPVGIGLHTGIAFVGSIGAENQVTDITALGDATNTAARLSSAAQAGEILASQSTLENAALPVDQLPTRTLELKGKSQPVTVFILTPS